MSHSLCVINYVICGIYLALFLYHKSHLEHLSIPLFSDLAVSRNPISKSEMVKFVMFGAYINSNDENTCDLTEVSGSICDGNTRIYGVPTF